MVGLHGDQCREIRSPGSQIVQRQGLVGLHGDQCRPVISADLGPENFMSTFFVLSDCPHCSSRLHCDPPGFTLILLASNASCHCSGQISIPVISFWGFFCLCNFCSIFDRPGP